MKTRFGRPFSSVMTRRALSIAATAAALFVTNRALADEAAPAPVETAPVFEVPRFAPVALQQDRPLEAPKVSSSKDESFRVGALVGVGFPRPFAAEGFVKIKKLVGVGFEYSFMPDASFMGTNLAFHGVAADVRVFPLKGGFFLGVRGGKQWLSTRTTITASVNGVPNAGGKYTESMNAETMFVNPRIGYLKTFDNGITLGFDAGVQIPMSPTYARESDAARAGIKASNADNAYLTIANTLGNKTTPTIDLLRVGFLF